MATPADGVHNTIHTRRLGTKNMRNFRMARKLLQDGLFLQVRKKRRKEGLDAHAMDNSLMMKIFRVVVKMDDRSPFYLLSFKLKGEKRGTEGELVLNEGE